MHNPENNESIDGIFSSVHESVRRSQLLVSFYEGLKNAQPSPFSFAAEFLRLRNVVAPQIGDTRILFPEFTPHDEPLHVAKLFQIADKFFGNRIYQNLNVAELFLLVAALYTHDWGMAVGNDELKYLLGGARNEDRKNTFTPLIDEKERLDAFIRNRYGLQTGEEFSSITEERVRLYVRETHALRSAARVRAHFHEYQAVAEALACICEGHGQDFSVLDDVKRFPHDYQVAGYATCLVALALQIRLIDLFHLTDDRTPYALWRFVSPQDRRSDIEWRKHRALNEIAVTNFHPGRAIIVQGLTTDEEVWAALEDLRRYCEEQVEKTLEISARHISKHYGLDFVKVEWKVPTGDLRPVDFRFEFDRSAMFRILSDDIYDGDCYVFLRELLQNAIDAIRTRRAYCSQRPTSLVKKTNQEPFFDYTIYFNVDHKSNGDIDVTCKDSGIGMDEHIIRNYFARAGVSYYRSAEFERQHLGFQPNSRFGIGILSCFMVADQIEAKTFRDPEFAPNSLSGEESYRPQRLSIKIPGVQRQFVVRQLRELPVGTEVTVHVLADKISRTVNDSPINLITSLADIDGKSFERKLEVSEFFSKIAGFVEFPILVVENWPGLPKPKATLILHPDRDAKSEQMKYEIETEVCQLSRAYPWEAACQRETLPLVQDLMVDHPFEFAEILKSEGIEGWIVLPKPKNENWDFTNNEHQNIGGGHVTIWRERETNKQPAPTMHWSEKDPEQNRKSRLSNFFSVYRDGILLSGVKAPPVPGSAGQSLPPVLLRVNLPVSATSTLNAARTSLRADNDKWHKPIWKAIAREIASEINVALTQPLPERFFRIGWLASVFRLSSEALEEIIPIERRLALWLTPGSRLEIREWQPTLDEMVPSSPTVLSILVQKCAKSLFLTESYQPEIIWDGPISLIRDLNFYFSTPLSAAWQWTHLYITKCTSAACMQFLMPPAQIGEPISQIIVVVHKPYEGVNIKVKRLKPNVEETRHAQLNAPEFSEILSTALTSPERLKPIQRRRLAEMSEMSGTTLIPIPFTPPFVDRWATRSGHINLLHNIGKAVIHVIAILLKFEANGHRIEEFKSLVASCHWSILDDVIMYPSGYRINLAEFINKLFSIPAKHNLTMDIVLPQLPSSKDQVPNILGRPVIAKRSDFAQQSYIPGPCCGACGKLVAEWPLIEESPPSQQ